MPDRKRGIRIAPEKPDQGGVRCMIRESDRHYAKLYPADQNHLLDIDDLLEPGVTFLVARCDNVLAGFGALAERSDEEEGTYGEIKRMYVSPAVRGLGIGRQLLNALEDLARSKGIVKLLLETGIKQPEAVALYESVGFEIRGPFGGYPDKGMSVFYEKTLT